MEVRVLEEAYKSWIPFESDPSPEVRSAQQTSWKHPSRDFDRFYEKVVSDFSETKDTFWLDAAIEYSGFATNKNLARKYLTYILDNAEKFAWTTGSLGLAATNLGSISEYPNSTLESLIEADLTSADEFEQRGLDRLKCYAYGAHISTATDFSTGFEEAKRLKNSELTPTIQMAEKIIAEWRARNQVAT